MSSKIISEQTVSNVAFWILIFVEAVSMNKIGHLKLNFVKLWFVQKKKKKKTINKKSKEHM